MSADKFTPVVETEEIITRVRPANNGAGPLWYYGSPGIVRDGQDMYVTLLEPDQALDRLCNTRWTVWKREEGAWSMIRQGDYYDEREPCPLVRLPGGRLIISANPLRDRSSMTHGGACEPHLLEFSSTSNRTPPLQHIPHWDKVYDQFSEHSYRGIGVDYENQSVLLFNIDGHHGYAWSLMDKSGGWPHQGFYSFPIRACYPQIGLKNGAAHVMAIGDIIETNPAWRAFKREKTGNNWDYDFRRLFYTWTPDIHTVPFSPPIEIASYENTAGYIRNCDLWIDHENNVHLLFTTKNIWHDYMRDAFFPDRPIISTVEYRVMKDGTPVRSYTLMSHVKDENDPVDSGVFFTCAGFHTNTAGRLFVVISGGGKMSVMQVSPWARISPVIIPAQTPLQSFLMPTPRNGSSISDDIDLYGTAPNSDDIHFARIRLDRGGV